MHIEEERKSVLTMAMGGARKPPGPICLDFNLTMCRAALNDDHILNIIIITSDLAETRSD